MVVRRGEKKEWGERKEEEGKKVRRKKKVRVCPTSGFPLVSKK